MPWPTTSGMRILNGAEASLIGGAIGMMVDTHVAELRGNAERWTYGVDWFDQWDPGQRLYLLEQVTLALLGPNVIASPTAVMDATADAIFFEIADLVEMEIGQSSGIVHQRSWRASVVQAYQCQQGRRPSIEAGSGDTSRWTQVVTRIADHILGVRLYQRAEAFRDGAYEQTKRFLLDRGLPQSYLTDIPPLRSADQIQQSIDTIQSVVLH